jgi:hypothetical protein
MSEKRLTRQTLEAWVELVKGERLDIYNGSRGRVEGTFPNGVRWELHFTAIEVTRTGSYYGRAYAWTHIRVSIHFGTAFHFYGKGARSLETWKMAEDILELLTGEPAR